MSQNPALSAKLDTVEGCKDLFGGGLFGGRAKKFHAAFAGASAKGVADAALLAERDFGNGNTYRVLAFSTTAAPIPQAVIAELSAAAEAVADVNLRDHGYIYNSLVPWDGGDKIWIKDRPLFRNLSRTGENIYVIPVQDIAGVGPATHVAWAMVGGVLHVAVVTAK